MGKDAKIIRVGDRVRIETPQFFVRCGYPKTLESEAAEVEKLFAGQITDLLTKAMVTRHHGLGYLSGRGHVESRARERIVRALAYGRLGTFGMGGSERTIYTVERPEFQGQETCVERVFFVKTGTYYAPSVSNGWDGYEYEPGGLCDEKTHKILGLNFWCEETSGWLSIEARNVVKLAWDGETHVPQHQLTVGR